MDYDLWLKLADRGVKFLRAGSFALSIAWESKPVGALVALHAEIVEEIYRRFCATAPRGRNAAPWPKPPAT
jgi:hypothetical protein